jgi:hypothetical protein
MEVVALELLGKGTTAVAVYWLSHTRAAAAVVLVL